MVKRIKTLIIIMASLLLFIFIGTKIIFNLEPKYIKANEVMDTVQSNYEYLEFRNKKIEGERGKKNVYLMDDIIPKIGNYLLIKSEENLENEDEEILLIKYKDGYDVILRGNKYLSIGEDNYEIVKGKINLDKFYDFIE